MTNVYVRKKPLLEQDTEIVKCINENNISVNKKIKTYDGKFKNKIVKYNFNGVFDDTKNNSNIFTQLISNNLDNNLTCFMYGQTGSGKTHTVLGKEDDEGIFILAGKELLVMGKELYISAYQIYNENIYDLLNQNNKLRLLEDSNNNFEIPELSMYKIENLSDLNNSINIILNNRNQSANNINITSSRSHAILIYKYIKDDCAINIKLIDLAGNERSKNSRIKSLADRLENKHINFSLFSLKECIRNIEFRKNHIPFRRSKLTSVLRECFITPHKSIMIATVCSNNSNYHDIVNTLDYSNRVNKLLKKPTIIEKYIRSQRKKLPRIKNIKKSEFKLDDKVIKKNKEILDEINFHLKKSIQKINCFNIKEKNASLDLLFDLKKNNKIILDKIKNQDKILNNIKK